MAGHVSGVQARIKEIEPKAHFTHCYGHAVTHMFATGSTSWTSCIVFLMVVKGKLSLMNEVNEVYTLNIVLNIK